MRARERRARILGWILQDGPVETSRMTRVLGVTDMTVRRDLAVLEQRGLVQRVYGGAVLATGEAPEVRVSWIARAIQRRRTPQSPRISPGNVRSAGGGADLGFRQQTGRT
jgi:DeoR/GlpR family transcriptional regulator of sugar metabolism